MAAKDPVKLRLDDGSYKRCLAFLAAMQQAGPRLIAQELNRIALVWQREIKRHMPVETGIARNSIALDPAVPTVARIIAQVGTNVPYTVYLEFGFKYGVGPKVKAWQPGQPVITRWYAKDRDLAQLEMSPKRFSDSVKMTLAKAYGDSTQEFMPPFRGSWQLLAPAEIIRLRNRVANLLATGKITSLP